MPPKAQPKKKVKTYSSDSILARSVIGIFLIALGVLGFLSVTITMEGVVFEAVKTILKGLGGGLCFLLPLFFIWGGILTALSARKKMSVKSIVLASLIYLCVLTIVNLLSRKWDVPSKAVYSLMEYIMLTNSRDQLLVSPESYSSFLVHAYAIGVDYGAGGGMLGMLLAWPCWQGLGIAGSVAVLIIAALGMAVPLLRLDIQGYVEKIRNWQDTRQAQREQEEMEYAAQEEAYRREEAQRRAQQRAERQPGNGMPAYTRRPVQRPYPTAQPQQPQQQVRQAQMRQEAAWEDEGFAPAASHGFYDEIVVPAEEKSTLFGFKSRNKNHAAPGNANQFSPDFEEDVMPWEENEPVREAAPTYSKNQKNDASPFQRPKREQANPSTVVQAPLYNEPVVEDVFEDEPIPPWESEPAQPAIKERTMRTPVAQPQPTMSGTPFDTPELKLPPQKGKKAQQVEMELPTPYAYPSLNMLKAPSPQRHENREEDAIRTIRLEETLESFRIPAKVKNVTHGPAIARFELELASGINVSRVVGIDKNIAMNLEVRSVRIEAPIPGKSLVGVEIPNKEVGSVTLREVLESDVMRRMESPLAVALGKDIAGEPIVCDLARMPHLLIAGATGSGKSVCINAIINSIIYRASPDQVRLILIDPKMVELQCYNCVPHLLIPVISDPHKAAGALAWTVDEMMGRYQKFKDKSVRNIAGYNSALAPGEEAMPRIAVIIDELADLMMTCKKEVEEYICRLAQLARAAGIHLVVATQRPSVDVITGLIKANIPSRIAFTVSSSIDSRTILDRVGAEKLLGRGDMLYLPNGELSPLRVQGCFMSDAEVNRVCDFIHRNCQTDFDPSILEQLDQDTRNMLDAPDTAEPVEMQDDLDPLLREAIEMAVQDGQTSISMLQRRMRIGYARAGRLIDEMSKRGIISQAQGAKPRQVLVSREELGLINFDQD